MHDMVSRMGWISGRTKKIKLLTTAYADIFFSLTEFLRNSFSRRRRYAGLSQGIGMAKAISGTHHNLPLALLMPHQRTATAFSLYPVSNRMVADNDDRIGLNPGVRLVIRRADQRTNFRCI
jgi:hypothetical protein